MATMAFPVNPTLAAIAIGYKNRDIDLVADRVMPRVPVAQRFAYTTYALADAYTVPATRVGRKSEPTQIDFGGTRVEAETVDWGLDDIVPNAEIEAWEAMQKPAGHTGPMEKSVSLLTSLVQLDREIRVANLTFATASYAAGQFVTLSGTSQWSDFVNSNPLDALLVAMDVPVFRPNMVVMGQSVWTKVRQHPRLIQAANASAQTGGAITRQQLADLLEIPVENVIVGAGFVNTARRGQTPNIQRIWGKSCALMFSSPDAANADAPTWGWTAQFGDRVAGDMPEPKMGLRGSVRVRAGESVLEVVTAPAVGYLFSAAVA
ncbi:MAG: major capsid protein [Acetobacteraceae bacterium]|nr:major capsid protein [Acetobacteraceae bacterium]